MRDQKFPFEQVFEFFCILQVHERVMVCISRVVGVEVVKFGIWRADDPESWETRRAGSILVSLLASGYANIFAGAHKNLVNLLAFQFFV